MTVTAVAAALAGCGGGGTAARPAGAPAASGSTSLQIKNFAFVPGTLTVHVGQRVTVTNEDSSVHTWTATDHTFDSANLAQGQSYSFTPTRTGRISVICSIHQYMTGTLVVT